MKKTLLALIAAMTLIPSCRAQLYDFDTLDTIYVRQRNYYYSSWYDECEGYGTDSAHWYFTSMDMGGTEQLNEGWKFAKLEYTPHRMAIKGLTAMIAISGRDVHNNGFVATPIRLPEYMYLYQYDPSITRDSMLLLDSVRWDTAKPKIWLLPLGHSDDSNFRCFAYEAYFKSPVYVDSFFYEGGSFNSNVWGMTEDSMHCYLFIPSMYALVRSWGIMGHYADLPCSPTPNEIKIAWGWNGFAQENLMAREPDAAWGMILPIVDNYDLNVRSDDEEMGEVTGSGLFPWMSYDTIRAIPHAGYRFSHWNDGNRENPRVVYLEHDTTFTAYFAQADYYRLDLEVNHAEWGTVEGDGVYAEQSPATISATPYEGYEFLWWNDGNRDNPRVVTVTQDTVFKAIFAPTSGIEESDAAAFSLRPNPTRDRLTVERPNAGTATLEVFNAKGQKVMTMASDQATVTIDVSSLAAGSYLLRVTTAEGSSVRSFVVGK